MSLILLLPLAAVTVAACTLLVLIVQARNRRLLLAAQRGLACDALDGIGVSVLCSGVGDRQQIENLLSVAYARYEVVVVLDGRRHPDLFAELVARYRMIRVEWSPTGELPVDGVRSVCRSRKRRFRRLVLVDRCQEGAAGDYDAAALVASYDYLLPVAEGQFLLPGAVERLVAELGDHPAGALAVLHARLGVPVRLVAREAVTAAGGFSRRPWRTVPRAKRRTLWEPLCTGPAPGLPVPLRLRMLSAGVLAAGIAVSAFAGLWPLTAVLTTAALVWAAAAYAAQAVATIPGAERCPLRAFGYSAGKIGVKNFTVS